METFPHLSFVQKLTGKPRFQGGGKSEKSEENKNNRQRHSAFLQSKTKAIGSRWLESFSTRDEDDLAPLDQEIVPIFFQINPDLLNKMDFDLQSLGIEIISEEDDGFIVGASTDGLRSLQEKIAGFVNKSHGSGKIADLWEIIDGNRESWKPKHILSKDLYQNWADLEDDRIYTLEVGVAFDKPMGKEPDPTKQGGARRLEKYREEQVARDEFLMEREDHFLEFIGHYGVVNNGPAHFEDSFGCEVNISGKGLKDLVINYPYVFEVSEIDKVSGVVGSELPLEEFDLELEGPDLDSPEVAVLDSGIMEGHKYIAPAIKGVKSFSYLNTDNSIADKVRGGGHGTKVAGAILYPTGITSIVSPYKLPCFVRNLRILNADNKLENNYPAALMMRIVEDNEDLSLFNLSVNANRSHRKKHMSSWAAAIDSLSHEKEILFIVSAGNVSKAIIRNYLSNGKAYPEYLIEPNCGLANPAQSSFALVVGSINHDSFNDTNFSSLGEKDEISGFSRTGTGIWGHIKPDVVEYGGGVIKANNGINTISENSTTAPELIQSTYHGGSAYGKGTTGTSFAAPKVSHIVARLRKIYPEEHINLIRALVVQGARLPGGHFKNPTSSSVRHFGYGIPSLDRVKKNSPNRITFYNCGELKAEEGHIYSLKIPDKLKLPSDDYEVLIEITMAYTAKVRRTRQKTKSYLGTWLDWTTSKIGEPFEDFKEYALRVIDERETAYDAASRNGLQSFNWKIKNRSNNGNVEDISRNNSTVQKDWAIVRSYELPESINLAIRAHKGWDKNKEEVPYALAVSIEYLNVDLEVYETIRIENEVEFPIEV